MVKLKAHTYRNNKLLGWQESFDVKREDLQSKVQKHQYIATLAELAEQQAHTT